MVDMANFNYGTANDAENASKVTAVTIITKLIVCIPKSRCAHVVSDLIFRIFEAITRKQNCFLRNIIIKLDVEFSISCPAICVYINRLTICVRVLEIRNAQVFLHIVRRIALRPMSIISVSCCRVSGLWWTATHMFIHLCTHTAHARKFRFWNSSQRRPGQNGEYAHKNINISFSHSSRRRRWWPSSAAWKRQFTFWLRIFVMVLAVYRETGNTYYLLASPWFPHVVQRRNWSIFAQIGTKVENDID